MQKTLVYLCLISIQLSASFLTNWLGMSSDPSIQHVGGIRGTVVARWTAGQQVERSILRQGNDSSQISSHSPRLSPAQYSLNSAESWPKTLIFILLKNVALWPTYKRT